MKYSVIGLAILAVLVSCGPRERIPEAPDYTSPEAWYVTDRGADVDLFYISSTETFDNQSDPEGTGLEENIYVD